MKLFKYNFEYIFSIEEIKDVYNKIEKLTGKEINIISIILVRVFMIKDYDLAINVHTLGVEETARMIKNIVLLDKE